MTKPRKIKRPAKVMAPAKAAQTQELKLTIELVPHNCWDASLCKRMPRKEWDILREQVYADHQHKCGICSATGRLNCHEIWRYHDDYHVQELQGFVALCELCHHVKHLGKARALAKADKLDYEAVVQHFMEVNQCDRDTFDRCNREATNQWLERGGYEWTTVLGDYEYLIRRTKDAPMDRK